MTFNLKIFAAILFLPLFAQAQEKPDFCRYLDNHEPAQGVEYLSGVDVHGKAVVPADLNSNVSGVYEDIVIPIEIDLINRYNINAPVGAKLEPVVADMTIHTNGRVDYNGRDLTAQAVALCEERGEKTADTPETTPLPENGQGDADPVSSSEPKGKLIEGHSP